MDQEKRERYEQNDIPGSRDTQEKRDMEETVSQKINWVDPEERYLNEGEFIGPNTYRTGKMEAETEYEDKNTTLSTAEYQGDFSV